MGKFDQFERLEESEDGSDLSKCYLSCEEVLFWCGVLNDRDTSSPKCLICELEVVERQNDEMGRNKVGGYGRQQVFDEAEAVPRNLNFHIHEAERKMYYSIQSENSR